MLTEPRGAMIASPFAAILSDRYGRLKAMFIGGWVIIVGMIIVSTGSTVAQFVVGRFVLGMGIAVMTVAAPAYAVEIAPPHWRGRCTGFYNCGWFGGSIPAAAVTYGTNYIDNDYSWRIPLILQAFACLVVITSVFFLPESPRFLMANGRDAEALDFLAKYHGNGDPSSRLVMLEVEEMKDNIRQDGIDKNAWDYRPFLFTHSGRWRMAQVLMISIFGQFSGNGLGYFNTVIFANIGVTSVSKQLAYNLLNSVLSAVGALSAVSLTDRMPRRKVLVIGTLGMFCCPSLSSFPLRRSASANPLFSLCRCFGVQLRPLRRPRQPAAARRRQDVLCKGRTCSLLLVQHRLLLHLYATAGRHPDRGARDHHPCQGSGCLRCHCQWHGLHQPVLRPHRPRQHWLQIHLHLCWLGRDRGCHVVLVRVGFLHSPVIFFCIHTNCQC